MLAMPRNVLARAFGVLALFAAGCASFDAERTTNFVNETGACMSVEYARTDHKVPFTAPNGNVLDYKCKYKVRVTLPDGTSFIAYRRIAPLGNVYKTDDEKWEFFEQGNGCIVAEMAEDRSGYLMRYQGVFASQKFRPQTEAEKRSRKVHSSSIPVVKGAQDSKGPRASSGPRTVE